MKPFANTSSCNWAIATGTLLLTGSIMLTWFKVWLLNLILPPFILNPNSALEEYWRKPPTPVISNVYIFNWTNIQDLHNTSIKPKFQEHGPYIFNQTMEKVNITWNNNNTVTYRQVRVFRFDDNRPNGNLSDNIATINLFAWLLAYKVKDWDFFSTTAISGMLTALDGKVHTVRTVEQILYYGYNELGNKFFSQLAFLAPDVPKFEKFGLLSYRNGSSYYEGVININNGMNGDFDLRNWNYQNETPYVGKKCAQLTGSLGELYKPIHSKEDINIFLGDICRTIPLQYQEDVVVNGMRGYKYIAGTKALDNGTAIPENKCYCEGKCLPIGMFNTSSCKYGLPIFVSFPHFYNADPVYLNSIEGLQPDISKHESYVVVEPKTGLLLRAVLRIQINVHLQPTENIALFQNLPNIFIPVLWIGLDITLPDHLTSSLNTFLTVPLVYSIGAGILTLIGVSTIIVGVARRPCSGALFKKLFRKEQAVTLKPEEMPLQTIPETCHTNIEKYK